MAIKSQMLFPLSPLITIDVLSKSEDFEALLMTDKVEVFYGLIHSIIGCLAALRLRDNPVMTANKKDITLLTQLCKRINKKKSLNEKLSKPEQEINIHLIHSLEQQALLEVISLYFRGKRTEDFSIDNRDTVLYNFVFSMHMHCKTQRSVQFYADEAKLSVGYFSNIIRTKTNKSPSAWIALITISEIKVLLERSNKSIKEIAQEMNFPEQFTFRKYFKLYTGLAPTEYRKLYKQHSAQKNS